MKFYLLIFSLFYTQAVAAQFYRPCHNGKIRIAGYFKRETLRLAQESPNIPIPFCNTGERVHFDILAGGYGFVRLGRAFNCGQYTDRGDGRLFISAGFSRVSTEEFSFAASYDPETSLVEFLYRPLTRTSYDYEGFPPLSCDAEDFVRVLYE